MRFGALGDIHGDFPTARNILALHSDLPFWLCVGDLADDEGRYEDLPAPVYWIKGNNENFDLIAEGRLPANLHHLPNGVSQRIHGIHVAGLGGTFAPSWYESAAAHLPHPRKSTRKATELADKRRHFVREEVESCKALRGVDVLLTHEAARPYLAGAGARRNDAGKTPINEILAAAAPRLHLFGHHHRFTDHERDGVRSIGLDLVSRSYLIVDADSFDVSVQRVSAG